MWLSPLLYPISLLYGLVVWLRGLAYDKGWFRSDVAAVPTVCVGNLAVGGTGKSPLTRYVAEGLLRYGRVGVLSRGYGRTSRGYREVTWDATSEEVGDEPCELRALLPQEVPVVVCEDRVEGCRRLLQQHVLDWIVLDDAYQHRRLRCTYYVLLTSYARPFNQDGYLPWGTLRDTPCQRKRAAAVVLTKVPEEVGEVELAEWKERLAWGSQFFASCSVVYGSVKPLFEDALPWSEYASHATMGLVTGIADATPLVDYVQTHGSLAWHWALGDHAPFTPRRVRELMRRAETVDCILTTGKDAARLRSVLQGTEAGMNELRKKLYLVPITLRWHAKGGVRLIEDIVRVTRGNNRNEESTVLQQHVIVERMKETMQCKL